MNTNINEKINENLNGELDVEQLEDVNGGVVAEVIAAGVLVMGMPLASWAIARSISRKVHSGSCKK